MSNKQQIGINVGSGLTFGSVLFFIFLILKLCGVIEWSWWWVTAPLWIGLGLTLVMIVVLALVWAIIFKN